MAERQISNPPLLKMLREAIGVLREVGRPDLGEAVQKATGVDVTPREESITLWISKDTWARAQVKAASDGLTRADAIEQGYTEVLAGRFIPVKPARATRNTGATSAKASPAVRQKADLVEQITAYAAQHAEEWGWEPSPAQTAVAWIEHYAPAEQK